MAVNEGATMNRKIQQHELKSAKTIKSVFMDMLKEQSLESIRVVDICSKAHLNRSSFYDSFSSIDDLFLRIQRDFIDGMKDLLVDYGSAIGSTEEERANRIIPILDYFKENKDTFLLFIATNDSDLLTTNLVAYLKQFIIEQIDEETDYLLTYNIMGGLSTVAYWLMNGMPIDEKKLAYICTPTINSNLIKK